ncbi:MAG: DNA topoisomerase IV subunit B [Oligoflexales bacterium]
MENYGEEQIQSLDWREHIRRRPGMYIGKLGNGDAPDDGIYVLVKEILDNSIDEFVMGSGKKIDVIWTENTIRIRDYGRGIPLGKVVECVSKINTGGKYDSKAFKKSVGLNGVGTKAVNALSERFTVRSFRDGKVKYAQFSQGLLIDEKKASKTTEKNGTEIEFVADPSVFKNYKYQHEFLSRMFWNYAFLNAGLVVVFNGEKFHSKNGLLDLLTKKLGDTPVQYPILHLKGEDIEIALTHGQHSSEDLISFVNGQYTSMGGSHQTALREGLVKAVRAHFKKDFDASDIRAGVMAAISVRVEEPVFESQTKTKLGSLKAAPDGVTIRSWVLDFMKFELDNALHRTPSSATAMLKRIQQSERERKDMAGIRKLAQERAKKASVYNKKLRDCRVHFASKHKDRLRSTIFITEGDSASGSITKARDVQTQAVFSLRGKPLNSYGLSRKIVYENEEFNLLQHALNIEGSLDDLRYNRIVLATDADVDGMHIRLLLMTFFLQFFPEIVERGHVYVLETPLFRVRDRKKTMYCYDELEKEKALKELGKKAEITRFKGLGEVSPDEFSAFIQEDMKLDLVRQLPDQSIDDMLRYYMGKNTPKRQDFIINHLNTVSE